VQLFLKKTYDDDDPSLVSGEELSKNQMLTKRLAKSGHEFDTEKLLGITSLMSGAYCFTERNHRLCRKRSLLRRAGEAEHALPPLIGRYEVNLYLADKRMRKQDRLVWLWRIFRDCVRTVIASHRANSPRETAQEAILEAVSQKGRPSSLHSSPDSRFHPVAIRRLSNIKTMELKSMLKIASQEGRQLWKTYQSRIAHEVSQPADDAHRFHMSKDVHAAHGQMFMLQFMKDVRGMSYFHPDRCPSRFAKWCSPKTTK
jgi:hypothetical protein